MARKGQKFRKYSPEFKEKILKEYFDGIHGYGTLAKKYGVSCSTIETWVKKTGKGIDVTVNHRKGNSGRKKAKDLTLEDYKERYEILKNTRPSYKHGEGKGDVYNDPHKRLQAVQPMRGLGGVP